MARNMKEVHQMSLLGGVVERAPLLSGQLAELAQDSRVRKAELMRMAVRRFLFDVAANGLQSVMDEDIEREAASSRRERAYQAEAERLGQKRLPLEGVA